MNPLDDAAAVVAVAAMVEAVALVLHHHGDLQNTREQKKQGIRVTGFTCHSGKND